MGLDPASFGFTLLLGLLAALPSCGIDMILPALSATSASLGVSPSDAGLAIEQHSEIGDRRPLRDTSPEIITMARRSVSLVRKF